MNTNSVQINTIDIQRVTQNGKQWLIAPVVAAVEGVMNNRLVQREDLGESVHSLNGRPIVIHHPLDENGEPKPANDPMVETIGKVFNAHIDGDSLKAEAWFEVDRLNQTGANGKRILDAINAKQMLEVSLGWFSEVVKQAGTFLNKQYTEIVHNLRHDHLAILLDTQGACSVDDGCGLVRNEEETQDESKVRTLVKRVLSELGFSQDEEILIMADKEPKQEPVVVIDNAAQFAKLEGLIESLATSLNGRIDEIQTNAANSEKAPIVARLVANAACPLEEATLTAATVSELTRLEASYKPADYSGNGGNFYAHVDANEGEYKTEVVS